MWKRADAPFLEHVWVGDDGTVIGIEDFRGVRVLSIARDGAERTIDRIELDTEEIDIAHALGMLVDEGGDRFAVRVGFGRSRHSEQWHTYRLSTKHPIAAIAMRDLLARDGELRRVYESEVVRGTPLVLVRWGGQRVQQGMCLANRIHYVGLVSTSGTLLWRTELPCVDLPSTLDARTALLAPSPDGFEVRCTRWNETLRYQISGGRAGPWTVERR